MGGKWSPVGDMTMFSKRPWTSQATCPPFGLSCPSSERPRGQQGLETGTLRRVRPIPHHIQSPLSLSGCSKTPSGPQGLSETFHRSPEGHHPKALEEFLAWDMGCGLERKLIRGLRVLSNVSASHTHSCIKAGQSCEQEADNRAVEAKSDARDLSDLGQVT